ncbi:MAG: hypothetical protein JKY01_01335 [Pseudomonadales bacterium]|nr:hypothetical protein [Pseudomonadales bacterium]
MNDKSGVNKDSMIEAPTAFERWELPALLEQEEIDKQASLVEHLPTLEEIEAIRADAYEEGFNSGKKQGISDGLKEGEKLTQKRITAMVNSFSKPLQQQDNRLERVLLDMTLRLSKAIIRREMSVDASAVNKIILEIFNRIEEEEGKFRIQINPNDMKGVAYFLEKEYLGEASYQLMPDKQISPGGCIIRSDAHFVDAQIETQLEKMVEEIYSQHDSMPVEILENNLAPVDETLARNSGAAMNVEVAEAPSQSVLAPKPVTEQNNNENAVLSGEEAKNASKVDLSSMPFFDEGDDEA